MANFCVVRNQQEKVNDLRTRTKARSAGLGMMYWRYFLDFIVLLSPTPRSTILFLARCVANWGAAKVELGFRAAFKRTNTAGRRRRFLKIFFLIITIQSS
jgi:hypothetical protein